jgi:hypothetical protein
MKKRNGSSTIADFCAAFIIGLACLFSVLSLNHQVAVIAQRAQSDSGQTSTRLGWPYALLGPESAVGDQHGIDLESNDQHHDSTAARMNQGRGWRGDGFTGWVSAILGGTVTASSRGDDRAIRSRDADIYKFAFGRRCAGAPHRDIAVGWRIDRRWSRRERTGRANRTVMGFG